MTFIATNDRLKYLRERNKLTKEHVCNVIEVDLPTLEQWETGVTCGNDPMLLSHLTRLTLLYKTNSDFILGLTGDES
jgi:DNA-binding XRE family transcriptional regulator